METIFSFLIRASLGMILFYLVYWFFLRKETFYRANRWFLLAALLTAVMLPLFPVRYTVFTELNTDQTVYKSIADTFKNIPNAIVEKSSTESFSWEHAILLIYLTGASIFLLRLLSQTAILVYLALKCKVKSMDGIRIVENEKYGLPFSFFNVVFINPKFNTQDDLPEILAHEKVHIRENHWFDLLFIELLTVIFWFNPFIWFFERSVKQNHEYLADEGVLAQGHNVGRYQALLINQLMGMQIIGITNNLNFALNKNRLKMMTKKKTSRFGGVKFAWALPVVALLLFAFAEPEYQLKTESEQIAIDLNTLTQQNKNKFVIKGNVIDAETEKPLEGASVVIKGTTTGTVTDKNGNFELTDSNPGDGGPGRVTTEFVVSYVGKRTVVTALGLDIEAAKDYTMKRPIKLSEEVVHIASDDPIKPIIRVEKTTPPPPPPPPANNESNEVEFMEGASTDAAVFMIVEDMPEFPGGANELKKWIKTHTNDYDLNGMANIYFTVDKEGKVTDVEVAKSDNEELGKAGVEIVKQMPMWKPGIQRGKPVKVKMLVDIKFD